jgi:hypothetical protein
MDDHQSVALITNPVHQPGPHLGSSVWRDTAAKVRNISDGVEGLPLVLRLALVDAMTGEPVAGAQVRIEQLIGTDTLCGSQSTDSKGIVRFTSLYPDRQTAFSCIALSVAIANDDQQPQLYQEAWAGRLHLPCVCNCTAVDNEAVRLALRPITDDGPEDGYFGNLTIGVDTFALSSQIGVAGYDKYLITVF